MTEDVKASFRQRLLAREPLLGTFLKTPTSHATEILSGLNFDFIAIDQEHGPFDRGSIDNVLAVARALRLPAFVRVASPDMILSVLDCGATGVIAPHVASAAYAREVAAACHYRGGKRGFAASTRAGGYSTSPMWTHIRNSDAAITVMAQIEDPPALDEIDAIAAVEGIDLLFIGRADLAAAYGDESADPPAVRQASERIAAAARAVGKPIGVFVSGPKEAEWLRKLGATTFILSSDQGFLRQGAVKSLADVEPIVRAKS
jgi:staphyloferrin B biosynthesis citrate synthase